MYKAENLSPQGGPVNSIHFDKEHPGLVYLAGEGLWKSADNGERWSNIELPTRRGEPVFLAAAQGPSLFVYSRRALWHSEDEGEHWQPLSLPEEEGELWICSFSASEEGRGYALISNRGFYRSWDRGETWEVIEIDDAYPMKVMHRGQDLYLLTSHYLSRYPSQSLIAEKLFDEYRFVAPRMALADAGESILLASRQGVRLSEDVGATWVDITPNELEESPKNTEWLGTFDPKDPKRILLAFANPEGESLAFYSDNSGQDWGKLSVLDYPWVWSMAISPHDPKVFAFGHIENGLMLSRDQGLTWSRQEVGPRIGPWVEGWSFTVAPEDPEFIAYLGGLTTLTSRDGGRTWSYSRGTGGGPFNLSIDSQNRLYAADDHAKSLFLRSDPAQGWHKASSIGGRSLALVEGEGQVAIYLAADRGQDVAEGLYKSLDGGESWVQVFSGFVYKVLALPSDKERLLLLANRDLYILDSRSDEWEKLASADGFLTVAAELDGELLLGSNDGQVYRLEGGELKLLHHWQDTWVSGLCASRDGSLVLATRGHKLQSGSSGLAISSDGGRSFTDLPGFVDIAVFGATPDLARDRAFLVNVVFGARGLYRVTVEPDE